jgi:hypothetical protein
MQGPTSCQTQSFISLNHVPDSRSGIAPNKSNRSIKIYGAFGNSLVLSGCNSSPLQ